MNEAMLKEHSNKLPDDDVVHAVLESPLLWELAPLLEPERDPHLGGRRSTHPVWVYLLWQTLIDICGGSRAVHRKLHADGKHLWRKIRRHAKKNLDEQLVPSSAVPARHMFYYAREAHLLPALDRIRGEIARDAARVARQVGLADPKRVGATFHDPRLSTTIVGDGKVIAGRSPHDPLRAQTVGDTGKPPRARVVHLDHSGWVDSDGVIHRRRIEADARTYINGGNERQHGLKYVISAIRGLAPRQMVYLAVDPMGDDTEVRVAARQAIEASRRLDGGARHWAYDKAARGTHIKQVVADGGLLPLVRPFKHDGRSSDKFAEVVDVKNGRTQSVTVHLRDGVPHLRTADVEGNLNFEPLRRCTVKRRTNKNGTHRFYLEYELPESIGGGTVTLAGHETPEDVKRGFNRLEHFRPIGQDELSFGEAQVPARQSIESGNRVIDRYLPEGRAHHWGLERNHLQLLTWMFAWNASVAAVFG